jgi:hypothetical protein
MIVMTQKVVKVYSCRLKSSYTILQQERWGCVANYMSTEQDMSLQGDWRFSGFLTDGANGTSVNKIAFRQDL